MAVSCAAANAGTARHATTTAPLRSNLRIDNSSYEGAADSAMKPDGAQVNVMEKSAQETSDKVPRTIGPLMTGVKGKGLRSARWFSKEFSESQPR